MEKEIKQFIHENKLSLFNQIRTTSKIKNQTIFKTLDAKKIANKIIQKISNNFLLTNTKNLFYCFNFTSNVEEVLKRQEFFKTIPKDLNKDFLKKLKKPRPFWSPRYGIVVVTDNETTFSELKNLNIPVKFLLNEEDCRELENYDIVQAVDVEQFSLALEQLPQSVIFNSTEDIYLERYLQILSGWKENFEVLEQHRTTEKIELLIQELKPLLNLIDIKKSEKLSREKIENVIEEINEQLSEKMKDLNINGESLFKMLSDNKFPEKIQRIIEEIIHKTNIPEHLFEISIPVKINQQELEEFLKLQDANENTSFAEILKKNAEILKKIPKKLEEISTEILFYDFISGISKFIKNLGNFPKFSDELNIENAKNLLIENPQPISFNLTKDQRCSILTGANSGGKTTLIEHIIQIITLSNIGLPISGEVTIPLFTEVYYFAKNKGSASKGAFETLLTQMSEIKPGQKTLILADEIEAVTEPGVAGKIIAATSQYFIKKNCFLIIATHLGYEIQEILPEFSRIDGIEAKGLNENNQLIVDHNPILGKLASSTPELIVEKMAKTMNNDYFKHLNSTLKKN